MRRPADSVLAECEIHSAVLERCVEDLNVKQVFHKELVLKELGFHGISLGIAWDYIVRRIEESGDGSSVKLIAVAANFFKPRKRKWVGLNSLLAGPGGKCAGYASATIENGSIGLAKVVLRVQQTKGAITANRNNATVIAKALDAEYPVVASNVRVAVGIEGPTTK